MARSRDNKPDPYWEKEIELEKRYRNWLWHALRDVTEVSGLSKEDLIYGFLREFSMLAPGPFDKEQSYKERVASAYNNYVSELVSHRSLSRPQAKNLSSLLFANESELLYITDNMKGVPDEAKKLSFVDPRPPRARRR